MFSRSGSFSAMYSLQRRILIVLYVISVFSLAWLMFYILHYLLGADGVILVISAVVYLVLVVILYSFIHVATFIPANLAGAFDSLKNDIASLRIRSEKILTEKLSEFMVTFFNFAFFDIECALVSIMEENSIFPREYISPTDLPEPDQLAAKSKESEETLYIGKIRTGRGTYHMYITPLVFGETVLGYIAVLSRNRLWKAFQRLLAEFENDFVDDQVVHVLGMKPGEEKVTH